MVAELVEGWDGQKSTTALGQPELKKPRALYLSLARTGRPGSGSHRRAQEAYYCHGAIAITPRGRATRRVWCHIARPGGLPCQQDSRLHSWAVGSSHAADDRRFGWRWRTTDRCTENHCATCVARGTKAGRSIMLRSAGKGAEEGLLLGKRAEDDSHVSSWCCVEGMMCSREKARRSEMLPWASVVAGPGRSQAQKKGQRWRGGVRSNLP